MASDDATGRDGGLFPALMKHWRHRRGLSQLDLALAADVSARHISFLETGRSRPSEQMVLRLAAALGVPMRHVNNLLHAAGHPSHYPDDVELPASALAALALVKAHHEPFPLVVIDRCYRVVDLNLGAASLFGALLGDTPLGGLNLVETAFDPAGAHPLFANFDDVGRELLWRLHREVLEDPDDLDLRALFERVVAQPTVDPAWRQVDFSRRAEPSLVLHLRRGTQELRFLTMVTAFQAPQNLAVDNLRIESWFPYDEATAAACHAMA